MRLNLAQCWAYEGAVRRREIGKMGGKERKEGRKERRKEGRKEERKEGRKEGSSQGTPSKVIIVYKLFFLPEYWK